MNFIFIFLFLLPFSLLGLSEPFRIEGYTGYRNDRIHWHLQNPGINTTSYSELYRDVQFWENGLVFKGIHRDIAFLLRGSYSAFGRGTLFQHYLNLGFTTDSPQFTALTSGWGADVNAYISYAANLTSGRHYKWIVLPLLGYSGHFERLHRFQVDPASLNGSGYQMSSSFPQMLRQTWYGVCLGVALQIEPGGRLQFNLGYTYHWLRTRFKTEWKDVVTSGSTVTSTLNSLHVNEGGNLGQTGWAQMDFSLTKFWKLGFGAQVHYFSTSYIALNLKQNNVSLPQTFKLRWTPIDGWLQLSREI